MKKIKYLDLLGFLMCFLLLTSCSEKEESLVSAGYSENTSDENQRNVVGKKQSKYMSYKHNISVSIEPESVSLTYEEIIQHCESDVIYGCVVLASSINTGAYQSSQISLRVKSEGVRFFVAMVSNKGEVLAQSTEAEDLSDRIQDNAKRVEMLTSYRDKLLILEAKPGNNIDSMIKIASELSNVQSQLEFAHGKSAKLFKRVDTDLLNISLIVHRESGFWAPVIDSLGSFSEEFSYGISEVVTASAYLIPWVIFLIVLFLVLRGLYRLIWRKI